MQKIDISTFKKYKEKLQKLLLHINLGLDKYNEYYQTLNELLSYDLSNIIPIWWDNLRILTDENHIADFSKTSATIDFNEIKINGYANFKNCTVRNVPRLIGNMYKVQFDDSVQESFPHLFLTDQFDQNIKDKWNGGMLTFDDVILFDENDIL